MQNYFCGWYFKCQSDTQTLALIPSFHRVGGEQTGSLQVITETGAWQALLPGKVMRQGKTGLPVMSGDTVLGAPGLRARLHTPALVMDGSLRFGKLSGLRQDIMGPFRYLPFMQCRHSVLSMAHTVNGTLFVNGVRYHFCDAVGYIEGDRGRSFPREYAWTQCLFADGSLMLSVADIPWGGRHFTGVIGVVRCRGQELCLATYRGARVTRLQQGEIVVRQGNATLTARLLDHRPHTLLAPVNGAMTRLVRESLTCRAAYRLQKGTETLLDFETDRASFEYEYPM